MQENLNSEDFDSMIDDIEQQMLAFKQIEADCLDCGMEIFYASRDDDEPTFWYVYDIEQKYESSKVIVRCTRTSDTLKVKLETFTFMAYDILTVRYHLDEDD